MNNPLQNTLAPKNSPLSPFPQTMTEAGLGMASGFYGTSGDDVLVGTEGSDAFYGRAGNDTLIGNGGADFYYFGYPTDGQDTIRDTGGVDTIVITARINDLSFHRNGTSLIIDEAITGRKITIEDFHDSAGRIEFLKVLDPLTAVSRLLYLVTIDDNAFGSGSDDIFIGSSADDVYHGGVGGNDILYGGGGNDRLDGGSGRDWLYGGTGDDIYSFNTFFEKSYFSEENGGGVDTLKTGYNLDQLHFRRSGETLVVERAHPTENIPLAVVVDQFNADPTHRIELMDTYRWVKWLKTGLTGGGTDDIFIGTTQSETFNGGGGNDYYFNAGGRDTILDVSGNDIYRVTLGDGVQVDITDSGGLDRLELYGRTIQDLSFRRSGSALVIEDNNNGKVILRDHYDMGPVETLKVGHSVYPGLYTNYSISAELQHTVESDLIVGTSTGDEFQGGAGDDWLVGGGGNDTISGGTGVDSIFGGDGNDIIFGDDGKDIIFGGAGGDTITGGYDRDIYYYASLNDSRASAGLTDVILDFWQGSDRIDLSSIDGSAVLSGNQSLVFIGNAPFSSNTPQGEVRYSFVGGNTQIDVAIDGDPAQDFRILLSGNIALTADEFIL